MYTKIILVSLLGGALLLSSCGAGKKLEAANQTISDLKGQVASLTTQNSQLTQTTQDQQQQLSNIRSRDSAIEVGLRKYVADCDANQQKLRTIQRIVAEQYAALQEMKAKIAVALQDFSDKGVNVYYKDGFVFVDMQESLLYASGSSKLGANGKKALGSLAGALNDYPHLMVYIVGNTDDKKFSNSMDNWTLSTERANSVVRVLRDNYQVDPSRLVAAGRGKYAPVADNSTADGRAQNRRTEIILQPDLQKLWDSVQP
jgi:chemotaxis protein MotB